MPLPGDAKPSGQRAQPVRGKAVQTRGDVTGMKKAELEVEYEEELAETQARMATVAASKAAEDEKVVNYTGIDKPLPEVDESDVVLEDPTRVIRIKFPIEQMAFGREIVSKAEYNEKGELVKPAVLGGIRFFDFDEGRRYEVPTPLANWLEERGAVWH